MIALTFGLTMSNTRNIQSQLILPKYYKKYIHISILLYHNPIPISIMHHLFTIYLPSLVYHLTLIILGYYDLAMLHVREPNNVSLK